MNQDEKPISESQSNPGLQASASVLQRVGNTPLVEIRNMATDKPRGRVFAKLESFNPGGSVKDRAGFRMLDKALESGALTKEKIILDATSGNTGIAYALWAAAKGFRARLAMPSNASEERKRILGALGVDLELTDPAEGIDAAILWVRELAAREPDTYYYPDQYSNPENWKAHFEGTGPEIWDQSKGNVTHFVAGLGTTGTFMGVGRFLKKMNQKIRIVAVQPDSPFHGLEGLKHLESALVPAIYRDHFPDEKLFVRTEDAHKRVLDLARSEGILAGISSGAVLHAALGLAQSHPDASIVTVFPDGAERYLSERFWEAGEKGSGL